MCWRCQTNVAPSPRRWNCGDIAADPGRIVQQMVAVACGGARKVSVVRRDLMSAEMKGLEGFDNACHGLSNYG